MTSHVLLLIVFAFLVSVVFAALLRDDPRTQIKTGATLFALFVGGALVFAWLMYPLPL